MMMFKTADPVLLPVYEAAPKPEAFTKPEWWDRHDSGQYKQIWSVLRAFLTGTMIDGVEVSLRNGKHCYYTKNGGSELWLRKNNPTNKFHVIVAKKVNGVFLGNASSLCGQKINGAFSWNAHMTLSVQEQLEDCVPMVPFRLFEEHKLDVGTLEFIERGQPEKLDLGRVDRDTKKPILRHFMGAMLFKLKGKTAADDRYFLFDIDRNELKLRQFNAFLTQLARPCSSIADAYASLKPDEVVQWEEKNKRTCPRQGEWFFIPVEGEYTALKEYARGGYRLGEQRFYVELRAGGSRAHYVTERCGENYVRGNVAHAGWEHKQIKLEGWHKAVPNSGVQSFKITGGID